jgi:hypothetical protein
VVESCLVWLLVDLVDLIRFCVCVGSVTTINSTQQQATRTKQKIYNNLQQTQQKQQDTQQSNGWGVSFACSALPLFLSIDLVRFFVCAACVTTINSTQQQQKLQ